MRSLVHLTLLMAALAAPAGAQDGPVQGSLALCRAVAAAIPALPSGGAISPRLTIDQAGLGWQSPEAAALRQNTTVHTTLATLGVANPLEGAGGAGLSFSRLAGADVYDVQLTEGTADCQTNFFFRGRPDSEIKPQTPPPTYSDLCWTDSAAFGVAAGRPAFVETNGVFDASPVGPDKNVEITPWSASGWGLSCRIKLRYRVREILSQVFCGDKAACAALKPILPGIAEARDHAKDKTKFRYGDPPGPEDAARARSLIQKIGEGLPIDTFGGKAKGQFTDFANEGDSTFPLMLGGRLYLIQIGQGGVGWRELGDTLLVLYAPVGAGVKPVASAIMTLQTLGLSSADVDTPPPHVNRH